MILSQEELIIYGDSITSHASGWAQTEACCKDVRIAARAAFHARGLRPILLGISGDRTGHLLWRLQHGEWPDAPPKVAILLIGTNDIGFAYVSTDLSVS